MTDKIASSISRLQLSSIWPIDLLLTKPRRSFSTFGYPPMKSHLRCGLVSRIHHPFIGRLAMNLHFLDYFATSSNQIWRLQISKNPQGDPIKSLGMGAKAARQGD